MVAVEEKITGTLRATLITLSRDSEAKFGGAVIFVLVITALFANLISPYNPLQQNLAHILTPPSLAHPLGQDELGRDVLSRMIYGSRISLEVGLIVTGVSISIGILVGSLSGYLGGKTDLFLMRVVDVIISFPGLILALGLMAALGQGVLNVIVSLSIVSWPGYARFVRGQALSVKELEYVQAAQQANASSLRILFKHIIPNSLGPVIVLGTIGIGRAIIAEAGLSFLGLGVPPNVSSWGSVIAEGKSFFTVDPTLMLLPGLILVVALLGFNLLGDSLRDALDPSSRF